MGGSVFSRLSAFLECVITWGELTNCRYCRRAQTMLSPAVIAV